MGGGAEAVPAIELPNALRIRQRLGQISTGRLFSEHLVPSIEALDRQSMSPSDLVTKLEDKITTYAEEHVMGIVPPMLESLVPKIINELVDDDQQKRSAFEAWQDRVVELKGDSVSTSQHIQNRYLSPRPKLSRKQKKAARRGNPKYRI